MLAYLRATNLGLIRDGEIHPGPGLTVITGETGAGKTLLLGALRLLLGETADSGVVGPFADEGRAEGIVVSESEIPVSRIVPAKGRSRAYRDGLIVSAEAIQAELSAQIQIVGQHDQLQLKRASYVLDLLDRNLGDAGREALEVFGAAWSELKSKLAEQESLGGSQQELARELDLARYQSREIAMAAFEAGEDETLEHASLRLRNVEEIKDHLSAAASALDTMGEEAGELVSLLRKVGSLDSEATGLGETAESLAITVSELGRELAANFENLAHDPVVIEEIDRRLNLLGDLKMKYGRTVEEINAYGAETSQRAEELDSLLSRANSIDLEVDRARQVAAARGADLSEARQVVAHRMEPEISTHLGEVGLDGATISFEFEDTAAGARGTDRVRLLFSSHERLQPGPIHKVASGGELSRLILAISLVTGGQDRTSVVFDEVDAGVGGATALAMGRKLADLAKTQQVLCVTHLPQVAAFADSHYVITRNAKEASVAQVAGSGRLEELSRMIAGLPESDRGQQAAAELLELSGK